jgi:hypothetical protein
VGRTPHSWRVAEIRNRDFGADYFPMIILGERHLRAILKSYLDYYHSSRTHLGLSKDTPAPRAVQPPELGAVVELPQVGGLHHRYERRVA